MVEVVENYWKYYRIGKPFSRSTTHPRLVFLMSRSWGMVSPPSKKTQNKFKEISAHLLIFIYRHQDDPVNEPGWDKIERAWTQAWPRPGDGGLKQEGLPLGASFWRAGGWGGFLFSETPPQTIGIYSVFESFNTIEFKTLILESLLLVSGPMSFCPNISDRIVSCFTLSVNQSSQFTSSVDPVIFYWSLMHL